MNENDETPVREALKRLAARVPTDACARVREADYHPTAPIRAIGVALIGVAALAAAAAVALSIFGLGAGTQRAFAGWSPIPTVPAKEQTARAQAACKARLVPFEIRGHTRGHAAPHGLAAERWRTMIADTRGPYTMVLLASRNADMHCLIGPRLSQPLSIGGGEGRFSGTDAPVLPARRILQTSYGVTWGSDRQPFSYASGRTGTDVSAVALVLADGRRVSATVTAGWFLAWWPGKQMYVAAEVSTKHEAGVTQTEGLMLPMSGSTWLRGRGTAREARLVTETNALCTSCSTGRIPPRRNSGKRSID
jgi:hypothetical protein